jgi:sensor c-di-GMP phosphodiesterase-like protein
VENETQYAFISSRYRDSLIQGWYFSKSLSRNELAKILRLSQLPQPLA